MLSVPCAFPDFIRGIACDLLLCWDSCCYISIIMWCGIAVNVATPMLHTSEKCSTHLFAWVSIVVRGFPSLSLTSSSSCHQTVVFHLSTPLCHVTICKTCCIVELWKVIQCAGSCNEGALQHVLGVCCRETAFACCVYIEVLPFHLLLHATCVTCT